MINRILFHTAATDYISYYCHQTFVGFKELEEKTQARLLALGYSPAIQCDTPTRFEDYGYDLSVECARGGLHCQLYERPFEISEPRIVHLGDLDEWLEKQTQEQETTSTEFLEWKPEMDIENIPF